MRNSKWLRLLAYVTGSVNQEMGRSPSRMGGIGKLIAVR